MSTLSSAPACRFATSPSWGPAGSRTLCFLSPGLKWSPVDVKAGVSHLPAAWMRKPARSVRAGSHLPQATRRGSFGDHDDTDRFPFPVQHLGFGVVPRRCLSGGERPRPQKAAASDAIARPISPGLSPKMVRSRTKFLRRSGIIGELSTRLAVVRSGICGMFHFPVRRRCRESLAGLSQL